MPPLVSLTLLAFGVVLVAALLVWTLLAPPRRRPARRGRAERPQPTAAAEPPRPSVTNDAVRGARVRPPDRPRSDDAFERFLRAGDDEA